MLASIVNTTDEEMILQLNCNATDFFGDRTFDTYLYYNPYPENQTIHFDAGSEPVRVYDLVERAFLPGTAPGTTALKIPPDQARLIVLVPAERSDERRVGNACFSTCRSRW